MSAEQTAAVAAVIRTWDWHNYGLDVVEDADPEYANALAEDIIKVLKTTPVEPVDTAEMHLRGRVPPAPHGGDDNAGD